MQEDRTIIHFPQKFGHFHYAYNGCMNKIVSRVFLLFWVNSSRNALKYLEFRKSRLFFVWLLKLLFFFKWLYTRRTRISDNVIFMDIEVSAVKCFCLLCLAGPRSSGQFDIVSATDVLAQPCQISLFILFIAIAFTKMTGFRAEKK